MCRTGTQITMTVAEIFRVAHFSSDLVNYNNGTKVVRGIRTRAHTQSWIQFTMGLQHKRGCAEACSCIVEVTMSLFAFIQSLLRREKNTFNCIWNPDQLLGEIHKSSLMKCTFSHSSSWITVDKSTWRQRKKQKQHGLCLEGCLTLFYVGCFNCIESLANCLKNHPT